jgi:hypothetical protein
LGSEQAKDCVQRWWPKPELTFKTCKLFGVQIPAVFSKLKQEHKLHAQPSQPGHVRDMFPRASAISTRHIALSDEASLTRQAI